MFYVEHSFFLLLELSEGVRREMSDRFGRRNRRLLGSGYWEGSRLTMLEYI